MIAALTRHWIESCRARGVPVPQRVHVLKLGTVPYPHPASPLVFLLFAGRAQEPGAAAKAARVSAGDAAVRDEAGWLADAHQRLPAAVAAAIPHCLASGDLDGRAFFLAPVPA